MKCLISFFTACLIFCGVQANAQVKTSLDSRSYSITLTPTGKQVHRGWLWGNDELSFMSGKMITASIKNHERFNEAKYVATTSGASAVKFTCSARNASGATLVWKGTVQGNKVSGTVTWKNVGGTGTYSFTGMAK